MGGSVSRIRKLSLATLPGPGNLDSKPVTSVTSIMEFIKPCCLKVEEKEDQNVEVRKVTLEEWLLSSPKPFKQDCINESELQTCRQSSRVCPYICSPSSMSLHTQIPPKLGKSISIEREMKLGEDTEESLCIAALEKSQSGKLKKVSFRLPVEADVHIIHLPLLDRE